MILFLVYAIVLGFFWLKILASKISGNTDGQIKLALALKAAKIRAYKQYGLLYMITLFYLVSVSMVSAHYLPEHVAQKKGFQQAWQLMLNFPFWLQSLFFIALILLIVMFLLPLKNAIRHFRLQKQLLLAS